MTEEKLQKSLKLQNDIKFMSSRLDKLEILNNRNSANAISIFDEREHVVDLHLCDAITHEVLGLLINHLSLERTKKLKEFEDL